MGVEAPVHLPLPRLGFVNGRGRFRACPRRHGLRLAISEMLSVHPKSYLHVQDGDVTHASTRELRPDRISEGSQLCTFHWPALGIKGSYRSVFSGSEMLRENLGVWGTCSFWFSSCRRGPEGLHVLQAPSDTEGADLKTPPESWGWAWGPGRSPVCVSLFLQLATSWRGGLLYSRIYFK